MKTAKQIAELAQMACVLEVCAPKPGNVNRDHDFSDTSLQDFLLSAIAVGAAFENADWLGIGEILLQAVTDTRRLVRSNTNLGIVLLLAPLVKACGREGAPQFSCENLRHTLRAELRALTVEDSRLAYAAIRLARPGGMGRVNEADISEEPSIPLLQAMVMAQSRDSVAREYATGFEITFEIGLPALREALVQGADFSSAIVQAYLAILSRVPDTLISRKNGEQTAHRISAAANEVLRQGGVFSTHGRDAVMEFDRELRDPDHRLNPGTTADLTTACIFLALLGEPRQDKSGTPPSFTDFLGPFSF
jgi:triphosphoribosyl-dephospho-CoA synthase